MEFKEIILKLNDLRKQKINGELDDSDHLSAEHIKWRNELSFDLLDEYIKHSCEEVCINIITLNNF